MSKQSKQERQAAAKRHTEAVNRLERLGKAQQRRGQRDENSTYRHQNNRVIEAEKHVPWWKR